MILLVFSSLFATSHAQNNLGNDDVRVEAHRLFLEKDYKNALPLFRELLYLFPKEPEYQFSAAVCIINLNGDLDEAIGLLRPSSVTGYNPLASYYLGRALHLNYSFEDAIKAYSSYILKSKGGEPGNKHVERLIEMARNGIEFTRMAYRVKVHSTETIQTEQLQHAAVINGSGKLMRKPIEFCSKTDIRTGYRPWMFLPAYTGLNEYIYTSGFELSKRNNKQLFRIRNINHETWGIPEVIDDVINTTYNEEYPFFDNRTSTLYFCSDGHSSMGGYDIFSAVYNWNTKTWSEPKNLGFPINSPYDDFLYITDGLSSMVSFVSTRSSTPGKAIIYRLKPEKEVGVRYNSAVEFRNASLLPVNEGIVKKDEESADSSIKNAAVKFVPDVKSSSGDYNKVLAEALSLQLKADSAARITRDLRIMAKEMPADSLNKQIISDILRNDKLAKTLQREADQKYTQARELKQTNVIPDTAVSTVTFTKEVNGIKVYQYRPFAENTDSGEPEVFAGYTETEDEKKAIPEEDAKARSDLFTIHPQSVYNNFNPIPQGLSRDSGLIYRVQLGVFSKIRPNDAFRGIYPVVYEQAPGSAMLKYYAGKFISLNGVTRGLESIRSMGFPDAFIVAFYNGRLITTEKAKEIEFAGFKL